MSWLLAFVIGFLLLDALRLRGRAGQLAVLLPTSEESAAAYARVAPALDVVPGQTESDHALVARDGVAVPAAALLDARAHAAAAGLAVVDLVPPDLPTAAALALLHLVDPLRYRCQPFAAGASALHAALVAPDVRERAAVAAGPYDAPAFLALARRLKRHACRSTGLAVAPGLAAVPVDATQTRALLRESLGANLGLWLVGSGALVALLVVGVVLEPAWGVAAAVVWHLYPALAVRRPLCPPDRWRTALLRLPLELRTWWRAVAGPRGADPEADAAAAARPWYEAELAAGPAAWFEPRRADCPQCGGGELARIVRAPDRFQRKPGRSVLEHCAACGTVFQNPRLNLRGLSFYYKDFYDGLGARALEELFAVGEASYLGRLSVLDGSGGLPGGGPPVRRPRRWLDVGTGHGHFPCKAREVLPDTEFEGLDLTAAVDVGARQGWIARAWRGLFPELAPTLAGRFDVVSMFHYLEHTTDPRAELRAARTALVPGGHLIVEVPDPASRMGRLLGSWWLPWLQPQHLNLLPAERLETLLREEGFQPLRWQRGEAHQPNDLAFAAALLLNRLAPRPGQPWHRPARPWQPVRTALVGYAALPLVGVAWLLDQALAPLLRRPGWANTYRVLAQRAPAAEEGAGTGTGSGTGSGTIGPAPGDAAP